MDTTQPYLMFTFPYVTWCVVDTLNYENIKLSLIFFLPQQITDD